MGATEKPVEFSWRVQSERAMKRDSIMPSKHKRADRRCVRWNARPVSPSINAEEKAK